MPSSFYFANEIANTYFKGNTATVPTTLYIALFLGTIARDGTGAEISAPSYSRKEIKLTAPTNGIVNNEEAVVFDQAQEEWGVITNYGVFDSATGGNLIFSDSLLFNDSVSSGETLTIPALQLQLSIV
jgi:hypothetical protein